jgi:hypothetical protein
MRFGQPYTWDCAVTWCFLLLVAGMMGNWPTPVEDQGRKEIR